jgi:hypothetical protein
MEAVLLGFTDKGFDAVHLLVIDLAHLLRRNVLGAIKLDVAGVGHGQTDKIETPIHHPF